MSDWPRFEPNASPGDVEPGVSLAMIEDDNEKRIVTVRAALRVFFGLAKIDQGWWSLDKEVAPHIKVHALRAIFIGWTGLLFEGVRLDALAEAFESLDPLLEKLDDALPDFYQRHAPVTVDYAVAAAQTRVEQGRRAASLVQSIATLQFRTLPFDEHSSYQNSLDIPVFYGPNRSEKQKIWRSLQRIAISNDCNLLRQKRSSPS